MNILLIKICSFWKSNFASNNRLIVKVHVILVIYTDMWIIAVW